MATTTYRVNQRHWQIIPMTASDFSFQHKRWTMTYEANQRIALSKISIDERRYTHHQAVEV